MVRFFIVLYLTLLLYKYRITEGMFFLITPEMIARINALARKKRTVGLSPQEQQEQSALRAQYIQAIRAQVKAQLDCIEFTDEPNTDAPKQ